MFVVSGNKTLIVIATVFTLAAVVVFILAARLARDWLDPFDDRQFVSAVWVQLPTQENRTPMARDLVRNHLPIGMTEPQVVVLLGPADDILTTATDSGGNKLQGGQTYVYYIGPSSIQGLDDAFVYVYLDVHGKVLGSEINGY